MMFGSDYMGLTGGDPQAMFQAAQQPPQQKGGMFAGNTGNIIAAALAGLVSRQNPQLAQTILQPMQAKQQQAAEEAQYARRRQQQLQDQQSMYDYELAHPKPTNNDTVADYDFWKSKLTPEQFQQYVENKVNPPQLMNIPGVGVVQVPRQASPAIPTAPVGALKPYNPGGPTQPASGGFPQ